MKISTEVSSLDRRGRNIFFFKQLTRNRHFHARNKLQDLKHQDSSWTSNGVTDQPRNQGRLFTPAPQVVTATLCPNNQTQKPTSRDNISAAPNPPQRKRCCSQQTPATVNAKLGHPATPGHDGTVTTPATHTMIPATAETFQPAPPVFWGGTGRGEGDEDGNPTSPSAFPTSVSHGQPPPLPSPQPADNNSMQHDGDAMEPGEPPFLFLLSQTHTRTQGPHRRERAEAICNSPGTTAM